MSFARGSVGVAFLCGRAIRGRGLAAIGNRESRGGWDGADGLESPRNKGILSPEKLTPRPETRTILVKSLRLGCRLFPLRQQRLCYTTISRSLPGCGARVGLHAQDSPH